MGDLPEFTSNPTCVKCWGEDVGTRYHGDGPQFGTSCSLSKQLGTSYPPEHLCRSCRRCGYSWPEAVYNRANPL